MITDRCKFLLANGSLLASIASSAYTEGSYGSIIQEKFVQPFQGDPTETRPSSANKTHSLSI